MIVASNVCCEEWHEAMKVGKILKLSLLHSSPYVLSFLVVVVVVVVVFVVVVVVVFVVVVVVLF